jgi:hypothetical protein
VNPWNGGHAHVVVVARGQHATQACVCALGGDAMVARGPPSTGGASMELATDKAR